LDDGKLSPTILLTPLNAAEIEKNSPTINAMADENTSSNIPSDDDSDKKETIRITLPPKADQPGAKRETVRIEVPESTIQSGVHTPKKETSKVAVPGSGTATPPVPRPPGPPAPPAPSSILKPGSSTMPPPKPPALSSKPTIPLRPGPPSAPSGMMPPPPVPPASGVMAKPVSPKKETARISLPSEAPKSSGPALPRATVKMQQTQPLTKSGPPASLSTAALTTITGAAPATAPAAPAGADTVTLVLSIVAFAASIAAVAVAWYVYSSATLADWAR
jgi:hypothetical protein